MQTQGGKEERDLGGEEKVGGAEKAALESVCPPSGVTVGILREGGLGTLERE